MAKRKTVDLNDPAMVTVIAQWFGRRGGLKGGLARAASLTAKRRREIAKKAAETRWSKEKK